MLIDTLLVTHIVVLGYWLGSELVINSEYRYVCWASSLPFPERRRLMEHVMDVDQHVRYALVLQATLGTMLAALLGYFPGGAPIAWFAGAIGVSWLAFVELVHRVRHKAIGQRLALLDRLIRYGLLGALIIVGIGTVVGATNLQGWLGWKLFLFGGVIACGVGIRVSLIEFFRVWREIETSGSDEAREKSIRWIYTWGTGILVLLWVFIAGIAVISILKPA